MKNEIAITVISIALILAGAFVYFQSFSTPAISNSPSRVYTPTLIQVDLFPETNVTRADAIVAISAGESLIQEMQVDGLPINLANDTLFRAKQLFAQADYAEIVRGNLNSTSAEKKKARDALALINWQNLDYSNSVKEINSIINTKQSALYALDSISVANRSIVEYGASRFQGGELSPDYKSALTLIQSAQSSFKQERYLEAQKFAENAGLKIEEQRSKDASGLSLASGPVYYLRNNWRSLVFAAIVALIIAAFAYSQLMRYLLRKKVEQMQVEKLALVDLIKRTQVDRFERNAIPELVYNLRMKKYQERLEKIKTDLPVLQKKLGLK